MENGYGGATACREMTQAESIAQQYFQAKYEFDESCRGFQQASQRKDKATAVLQKLTADLQNLLEKGMFDPTVPQALPQPAYKEVDPDYFKQKR